MTEGEWLDGTDPRPMLEYLGRERPSDRRFWLFACAYCRSVWPLADHEQVRKAVEAAERYADGQIGTEELWKAVSLVSNTFSRTPLAWQAFVAMVRRQFAQRNWEEQAAQLAVLWARFVGGHLPRQADLLREVFNPFRPETAKASWLRRNDGTVVKIAQAIYDERRFGDVPILADALEDAGCDEEDILAHCRLPGEHVRGCWVVDALLGKS